MLKINSRTSGRHFLQIPGPTNVPDRILRAIDRAIIDHRGPRFAEMMLDLIKRLKEVFKTSGPVIIYPASGSGAWEAALTNILSPGDCVLAFETGYFATLWKNMAENLGLEVDWIEGDWRRGLDPNVVETKLAEDRDHKIKAVLAVHNETSTGVTSRVSEIRQAMDRANHPALLLVDAISSLGCTEYQHDNWGIDVTICGSQKGLMLPPGLSFNALSAKAIEAAEKSNFRKSYWDWKPILQEMAKGFFPYTPATGLLYGLSEAVDMLLEEGLGNVFDRHARLAEATRRAVDGWDLENACKNSAEYSNSTTAVLVPDGYDADALRKIVLEKFDMSLGTGLGRVKGKVFRIGHLGDFNALMLAGTLCGVEMGLKLSGIPHQDGGVKAGLDYLSGS